MKTLMVLIALLFSTQAVFSNDIFTAIEKGDAKKVLALINNKDALHSRDRMGRTPLLLASYYRNSDILDSLIRAGADLKARDARGVNALMYAVGGENLTAMNALRRAGIDVNHRDLYGFTALMLACGNNGVYRFNAKPLFSACNTRAVAQLVDWGADVHMRNNNGERAVNCAAFYGHVGALKILIEKKADINSQRNGGWSPLLDATLNSHVDFIKVLLQHGADTSLKNGSGYTALMESVNSYGKSGFGNNRVYPLTLLVKYKKDLEIKDNNGRTALFHAAFDSFGIQHNLEALKVLLENGAELHTRDKWGFTPLHCAAEYALADIVRFLLEKGADVNALSNDGISVLTRSMSGAAREEAKRETVNILLSAGANPSQKSINGSTPLLYASSGGLVDIMRILISKGAGVNDMYQDGRTALMFAAYYSGNLEAVKLLTESGADVKARDKKNKTALDWAEESFKKNPGIIRYLQERMKK